MTAISVRTFVRMELQRVRKRIQKRFGGSADSLDTVETVRTIGDCIETANIERRLPDGWKVDREIVQFPGEPLAEVIRLTGRDSYRITLKPVDIQAPTERIEIYTRLSPATDRQHHSTVDSLSQARTTAERLATTHTSTRTRSVTSAAVDRDTGS